MALFVDPDFPATTSIIGPIDAPLPNDVCFLRPHEFMADPKVFEDGIEPTDIQQGLLGDCYFLAALAALSEWPKRIERLIQPQGNGKYVVNYCCRGEWTPIVIDDFLPTSNKTPLFSRAHGDELWVLLLEKAYAKAFGSYAAIEGGLPFLALADITGMPVKRLLVADFDPLKLWKKLDDYDRKDYAITANVPDVPDVDLEEEVGLVENHAYTVIGAAEADGAKLLRLRNPWGEFEWKGAWRDDDPQWTPALRKKLGVVEADDGIFYMAIEDFVKYFDEVTVLYYKKWDVFRSVAVEMRAKQAVVSFDGSGEAIFTVSQNRTDDKKIALRMWALDERGAPIGGNSETAFLVSSNIRGRKLKVPAGTSRLVIEAHQSMLDRLPVTLTLSVRAKNEFAFKCVETPAEPLPYLTKQAAGAAVCAACKQPLPAKGIAKTKVGTFHIKCFRCDRCGAQLGAKFGLLGSKKLCPACVASK